MWIHDAGVHQCSSTEPRLLYMPAPLHSHHLILDVFSCRAVGSPSFSGLHTRSNDQLSVMGKSGKKSSGKKKSSKKKECQPNKSGQRPEKALETSPSSEIVFDGQRNDEEIKFFPKLTRKSRRKVAYKVRDSFVHWKQQQQRLQTLVDSDKFCHHFFNFRRCAITPS